MEKRDIVICASGDDSSRLADALSMLLRKKHYTVINGATFEQIADCKDVILLMEPGCLNEAASSNNTYTLLIQEALTTEKNVIPVAVGDFYYPAGLPRSIESLTFHDLISCPNGNAAQLMDKLSRNRLTARPASGGALKWVLLALILLLLIVAAVLFILKPGPLATLFAHDNEPAPVTEIAEGPSPEPIEDTNSALIFLPVEPTESPAVEDTPNVFVPDAGTPTPIVISEGPTPTPIAPMSFGGVPTGNGGLPILTDCEQAADMGEWMVENCVTTVELDESSTLTVSDIEHLTEQIPGCHGIMYSYREDTRCVTSIEIQTYVGINILNAHRIGRTDLLSAQEQAIYREALALVGSLITPGMSDYEIELALHDYIIYHCEYEVNEALNTDTVIGFFESGRLQCSGYADTFMLLGGLAGLDVRYAGGVAYDTMDGQRKDHAWNYICLNGAWYMIDLTWDDPAGGHAENHDFFNVPWSDVERWRTLDSERHLPNGTLAAQFDAYNWYVHNGYVFTTIDEAVSCVIEQHVTASQAYVLIQGSEPDIEVFCDTYFSMSGASNINYSGPVERYSGMWVIEVDRAA